MSFHTILKHLITQIDEFELRLDDASTSTQEQYQTQQHSLASLKAFYTTHKRALEDQAANDGLTGARKRYYKLEKEVVPFLAQEKKTYYFLQIHKIESTELLKTFQNSSFQGDWDKIKNLADWRKELIEEQEAYDGLSSIEQSIRDIHALGNFNPKQAPEKLKELQKEVANIQSLWEKDPSLKGLMETDDRAFVEEKIQFLEQHKALLDLPPTTDEDSAEEATLEEITFHTHRLLLFLEDFMASYTTSSNLEKPHLFRLDLKHYFDLKTAVFNDMYQAIVQVMGSYQAITAPELQEMLAEALAPFKNLPALLKKYSQQPITINENSMPSTDDLTLLLNGHLQ